MSVHNIKTRTIVSADSDVYRILDYMIAGLEPLTLSTTELHKGKSTRGHSHASPEIYCFYSDALIQLAERTYEVKAGQMLVVRGDTYHRVFAGLKEDVRFLSVYWGEREGLKPKYGPPPLPKPAA